MRTDDKEGLDPRLEKRWRLIEQVVALLEKSLTPSATVLHDQRLPELVTGNLRQCDVVIRYGQPPRETLTIVEVQDRGEKVDIATYEGWCSKREKLGAQHLICVSTEGFPESIQKDAALRGETVRLMTLCGPDNFPAFFRARRTTHKMRTFSLKDATVYFTENQSIPSLPQFNEKQFEQEGNKNLKSLDEIAFEMLKQGCISEFRAVRINDKDQEQKFRLIFSPPQKRVWLVAAKRRIMVADAEITYLVEDRTYDVPIQMLAYEQINKHGTLGWVTIAVCNLEGNELYVRTPFILGKDDRIYPGRSEFNEIPGLVIDSSQLIIEYEEQVKP